MGRYKRRVSYAAAVARKNRRLRTHRMGKIRKGQMRGRVGIRKAYKQVRDTVLTMNTPKYFRFALEQGSYCTTLSGTSTVIT